MLRELLRLRWLPWHAALVAILVAFVLLGRWQLGSFEGADDEPARASAAVPLTSMTDPGARLSPDAIGTVVRATGSYDEAEQLFVPERRHDGRDGTLVVALLRTDEGILPVLRGWVPGRDSAPARAFGGDVEVTGVLRPSETEQDSTVDPLAELGEREIPYLSSVLVLSTTRIAPGELYDGYLTLTEQRPAADPAPALVEPRDLDGGVSRWRNLAYALQWWLFAGAAVFFWWAVIRRSARDRELAA